MPFDFVFDAFVVPFWRCKDSKKRWEQRIERRMFYGKDERLTTFHARVRARFEKMRKRREVYLSSMDKKRAAYLSANCSQTKSIICFAMDFV
jgi:hypothetical protein